MAAAMNMAPRSPGLLAGPHETRSAAAVFQGHQHRPQPYPSKSGLCTNGLLDWGNEVSEADGPQKCRTVNALGWEMLVGGGKWVGGWELRVGNGWGVGRAGVGIAGGNGNSWGGGIFLEWEMKWLYCEIVGVGNDWGEKWLWWEMVGIQNSCTL